jgi:hypothetical protein
VVGTVSDGAPAPWASLGAAVWLGDPPPSDESVWEFPVWRLDSSVVAWQWRLGFCQIHMGQGTIYRGFCTES